MERQNFLKRLFMVSVIIAFSAVLVYAQEGNLRQTPVVKVVHDASSAVVNISTEKIIFLRQHPFWGSYGSELDATFDQFFGSYGMVNALKLKSVGSGVIVDKSGLIVTNAHVVNMASNIFVILNDGSKVEGVLVYENKKDDLALIRIISSQPFAEAKIGQTNDLMLGETVVAIGNPLGLENSVTSGILSGKNRKLYSSQGRLIFDGLLQSDAPINPGSSGGALFNLNSELIGINVAMVESSQGIGFAIPVEKAQELLKEYRNNQGLPVKADNRQKPLGRGIFYNTGLNTEETSYEYIVKLDIEGLDQNKVNIEVNQGAIKVTGERSVNSEGRSSAGFYRTQSFGSFSRVIPLPQDADPQGVKTEVMADTLVIHIAKKK